MRIKKILENKTVKNANWLIGGKIIQMILSLFIGLITARYLGPSNFGLINYAAAYTTFFASLCTLGLNGVLVKELVDHPDSEGEIVGTAIVMREFSSFFSFLTIIGCSMILDGPNKLTITVVVLCNVSLLFQVFDTFNYWFQAHLLSKYTAISTLIAYISVSVYRLVLLMSGLDIRWFAFANSVDYIVVAISLLYLYKKCSKQKLTFSKVRAKSMIRKSYHFILSGLMISIYNSSDRLMLKQMMTAESVGYYSTAVTICTMWAFILMAIIDSLTPNIMMNFKTDYEKYKKRNKQLYAIVFYMSVFVSLFLCVFAKMIIQILYGAEYLPAVQPLRVITWYVAFSYLGSARDAWAVCEDKQRYLKYIYMFAAVANVGLNALFIPKWGATGAAFASLLTQICTCLIFPALLKPLRENSKLMIESIFLKGVF